MKLPEQIYIWDEQADSLDNRSLNMEYDGARPTPEPGDTRVCGVYVLQRVVEVSTAQTITETPMSRDDWFRRDR